MTRLLFWLVVSSPIVVGVWALYENPSRWTTETAGFLVIVSVMAGVLAWLREAINDWIFPETEEPDDG